MDSQIIVDKFQINGQFFQPWKTNCRRPFINGIIDPILGSMSQNNFTSSEMQKKGQIIQVSLFAVQNTQIGETVVVAQLTARSLPIPEDPGSKPVIGNFY